MRCTPPPRTLRIGGVGGEFQRVNVKMTSTYKQRSPVSKMKHELLAASVDAARRLGVAAPPLEASTLELIRVQGFGDWQPHSVAAGCERAAVALPL